MQGVEARLLQLDVVQRAGAGRVPDPQDPHLRVWHHQQKDLTQDQDQPSEHTPFFKSIDI